MRPRSLAASSPLGGVGAVRRAAGVGRLAVALRQDFRRHEELAHAAKDGVHGGTAWSAQLGVPWRRAASARRKAAGTTAMADGVA